MYCAAMKYGVTIFPQGKIGPCCQINSSYLKPINQLLNPNKFADLIIQDQPTECQLCTENEFNGITSLRSLYNKINTSAEGIQFLDIRNTNFCNLKCRYCGPHFSSQWDMELTGKKNPTTTDITSYYDTLFQENLHWLYFTGGEPLINFQHWEILELLIEKNLSQNISLIYNTNLTTIAFKNKNIFDLWKHFKNVKITVSIDAVGIPLEFIRFWG